jgi:cytochrome b subunit of formate dehydrogenase
MIKYLLFIKKTTPSFGKYNFEQKFTYWFIFLTIAVMVLSGLVIWFPIKITQFFPGGIVPAAKLAHSTEAVVAATFILIWHIFHVLIHRVNLSMFSGKLSEREMRTYHNLEYERLTGGITGVNQPDSSGDDA